MMSGGGPGPDRCRPDIFNKLSRMLDSALRQTRSASAAIARRDGLIVAHRLAPQHHPLLTAAIGAATLGAGVTAAAELGQGDLEQVVIECSDGRIVIGPAGPDALIVAFFAPCSEAERTWPGMRDSARTVASILEEL